MKKTSKQLFFQILGGDIINNKIYGIIICLILAIPSFIIGNLFPLIGGPIIAIILGMAIAIFWKSRDGFDEGISFTSKYVLQLAVVFLGFGLNLNVILATGIQSLPIIVGTISTALLVAFIMKKVLNMKRNSAILIGVGSSICGGSAIAATAPVIGADDEEVAQSISVIFFFNVIAAIIFPIMGKMLGFSTTSGGPFGIFAGTAINDTSSVTAAAATWDNMWNLGSQTLDKAATVKLTRTLAIIPITLALSFITQRGSNANGEKFSLKLALGGGPLAVEAAASGGLTLAQAQAAVGCALLRHVLEDEVGGGQCVLVVVDGAAQGAGLQQGSPVDGQKGHGISSV